MMPKTPIKKKSVAQQFSASRETPRVSSRYIEAIGRRKTAVARVRVTHSEAREQSFLVNEKPLEQYFQDPLLQATAKEALHATGAKAAVLVKVGGGGLGAQAEAIRLGIARALVKEQADARTQLKSLGYLTRDPRMRERKKFGLKRARRARQWRKR